MFSMAFFSVMWCSSFLDQFGFCSHSVRLCSGLWQGPQKILYRRSKTFHREKKAPPRRRLFSYFQICIFPLLKRQITPLSCNTGLYPPHQAANPQTIQECPERRTQSCPVNEWRLHDELQILIRQQYIHQHKQQSQCWTSQPPSHLEFKYWVSVKNPYQTNHRPHQEKHDQTAQSKGTEQRKTKPRQKCDSDGANHDSRYHAQNNTTRH